MIKKKKERNTSKTKRERSFWYTDEIEVLRVCEFDDEPEVKPTMFMIANLDFLDDESTVSSSYDEYRYPDDESSCVYSYDWCPQNERYVRRNVSWGCPSCGYGGSDVNSYGLRQEFVDRDLRALFQLKAAIFTGLCYAPYRVEQQSRVDEAFEFKEKLDEMFGDDLRFESDNWAFYWQDDDESPLDAHEKKVRESMEQCEAMIKSIKRRLEQYMKAEQNVTSTLPLLACSVYRSHLQQLAIQELFSSSVDADVAGWKHLKERVSARAVPAVGIIMQCVLPFLLDGDGEQNRIDWA